MEIVEGLFVRKESLKLDSELLIDWKKSFQYQPEGFLEDMCIFPNDYCVLHDKERKKDVGFFFKGKGTIAGFYILNEEQNRYDNQKIFNTILEKYEIKMAMLGTTDLFFMNHMLAKAKEIKVMGCAPSILKSEKVELKHEMNFEDLILAKESDIETIWNMIKDEEFFIKEEELKDFTKKGRMYILYKKESKDEIVAVGLLSPHKFFDGISIGMCVNKKFRRRGVGTYIVKALCKEAMKKGAKIVTAGCDARNIASVKTQQKSGMVFRGRFLCVNF